VAHAGDLLAELLARHGTEVVFGQPGGQTAALYDGIHRRAPRLRHVLVRDERSAGYAADAYARLTGRPGVCDVTVGPGTTKLADGLVESYNASVPVIALVGELPRDWEVLRHKGVGSQGFDQVRFLSAMTKMTWSVPSLEALPGLVRSAYRWATSGRPAPVALVVPHDVLDAEWDGAEADAAADERYTTAPAFRPVPPAEDLAAAAELLRLAERPAIVAGGGVHGSGAWAELGRLAARIDALVLTSFSGKGSVAETAPFAGGVLNPLGREEAGWLAERADVLFWCGCKVGQNTSLNWTLPGPEQATIQLDLDATELGRTFRPTVALNGDARAALAALGDLLEERRRPGWLDEVARARSDGQERRDAEAVAAASPLQPARVMRELARRLQPEDVVVSDASFSAGWLAAYVEAREAGRSFLFARGQGGLGYAVPAAIGAAFARPGGRVVTVSGDGGFSYAVGELATHAQHGLRTVNLVLNNGSLGWLKIWEKLFFDGLRQSVDLEAEGVTPGFGAAAAGLGCAGFAVESPDALGDVLDAAFAAEGPSVVDVHCDPWATPVHGYRRRLAEGGAYARPGTVYGSRPWHRSPESPQG
jgi:acetolactate synthase-1/2/3 large subunit